VSYTHLHSEARSSLKSSCSWLNSGLSRGAAVRRVSCRRSVERVDCMVGVQQCVGRLFVYAVEVLQIMLMVAQAGRARYLYVR
jgi:hypothetical protein